MCTNVPHIYEVGCLKVISIRSGMFLEQQVIALNEMKATFHANRSLYVTEMCNISLDEMRVRYVGNIP